MRANSLVLVLVLVLLAWVVVVVMGHGGVRSSPSRTGHRPDELALPIRFGCYVVKPEE